MFHMNGNQFSTLKVLGDSIHNSTLDIIHLQQEINKLDEIVYEQEVVKITSKWEETLASLNPKNWFGRINLANIGNSIVLVVVFIGLLMLCRKGCVNKAFIRNMQPEIAMSHHAQYAPGVLQEDIELQPTRNQK